MRKHVTLVKAIMISTPRWVRRPHFRAVCGNVSVDGYGLAVCPVLGLLVLSDVCKNTLLVLALPESSGGSGGDLILKNIRGGPGSPAPMQFKFSGDMQGCSGYMAFTSGDDTTPPLLLVTDAGHSAVHVIDMTAKPQMHVGFVCAPGSVLGPRCVASKGSLVAISTWKDHKIGDHIVQLFEGSGSVWTPLRVLGGGFGHAAGQLYQPFGVRFSADGQRVVVADAGNGRVSTFFVADGSFERHLAQGLDYPIDIEECEGGWLAACWLTNTLEFIDGMDEGRVILSIGPNENGTFKYPAALSLTSSLGLVVRQKLPVSPISVFATPDMVAMDAMSIMRVAWMGVVARVVNLYVERIFL